MAIYLLTPEKERDQCGTGINYNETAQRVIATMQRRVMRKHKKKKPKTAPKTTSRAISQRY